MRTQSEWSAPQRLSVSTAYLDANPVCTSDGARLYFTSRSPLPAPLGVDQADLWVAERGADGVFGAARRLAAPVNSNDDEERAAAAASGALYFSSNRRGGFGATDLFRAVGGEEQRLPGGVNSPHEDADPFVDPDERYLVFRSDRPGGAGCCDLYISFRHRGVWSAPRNLGPAVNTEGCEASPHVDPSGEHLLFTRGDHAGGRDLWTAPFASLQPEAGTP